MKPREVTALATGVPIAYLVETREDDDCPHGGVCVVRVIGPAVGYEERTELEALRQKLRAQGRWTHMTLVDDLDWPEVATIALPV